MPIAGLTPEHFHVFAIPGFDARMFALRARITPALTDLAPSLAPGLSALLGHALHPHVARHLRRSVNPPEETWAAFARSPRAYKPFVHLRLAINAEGVKIACFVEDDARDKPAFAAGLQRQASALAGLLASRPEVRCHNLLDESGRPLSGARLDAAALSRLGERLARVKGQHAQFSILFPRTDPRLADRAALLEAALSAMERLAPLYRLGAG